MIIFYIVSGLVLLFLLSWAVMIKPSGRKHPLETEIKKYIYAHRGLHRKDNGIPENSLPAFCLAQENGYGIELDIHLSADGTPVIIHDTSLRRTAGEDIDITDIHDSDIPKYSLEGTNQTIPFFSDVLRVIGGRVPLLIELKVDNDNYRELTDRVMNELEGYTGIYAVQSFDPRAVNHLRKSYPHIMRGQLAGFLRKNGDTLHRFLDFGLRNLLTNFITKPHFISYRVQDTDRPSMKLCRTLYKPFELNWTCKKKAHHIIAHKNGAIPIFENYIPEKSGESPHPYCARLRSNSNHTE
ncbi:MAG: glycerophosphodiester phosphodiesterase [Clostridia bacterium]|nr:glycerophosphodiester phosphodiesterase [Clostridia bacterium]